MNVKTLFAFPLLATLLTTPVLAADKNVAVIKTNLGDITLELFEKESPLTVANFKNYIGQHFYDGTIFHRTIPGFMIQGGGFNENFEQKATEKPIQNESSNGLGNTRGTLAMARTSAPHSATAQFFINVVDNEFLNAKAGQPGYAVFGKVTSGMEIVDVIAVTPTQNRGMHQNVPVQSIVIESISLGLPEKVADQPAAAPSDVSPAAN